MSPYLRSILAVLFAANVVVSCTRAPDLVGIDNASFAVSAQTNTIKRTVYIATTREATEVTGVFYSGERAPDVGFASVVVSIPPTHESGMIERPKKLPPDPRTEFAVIDPVVYQDGSVFVTQINRALAALPPKDRNVLLFVPGYNNTISDSILRLAQFVEDTEFTGVPVLFSWASAAKASHYVYDLNSALIARPRLLETAAALRRTNASGFNVFAHSMGSLLVVETIVQSAIAQKLTAVDRVDNIMLAAPDIDLDLFKSQLAYLPPERRNFIVFVSEDDKVLGFSKRLSGGVSRVGSSDEEQLSELGVSVINLTQIENSASGSHSKFAGSPEVVQLIGTSLQNDNFGESESVPRLVDFLEGVPVVRQFVN